MIIEKLSARNYETLKSFLPAMAKSPINIGRFESFRMNGLDGQEVLSSEMLQDGSVIRIKINDELIGARPGAPVAQFLQSLRA